MRQGPNPRRLRGRNNGRKNGPTRHQSVESNGPDIKVRGNPSQVLEKYLALARDATSAGDRIAAEGYFQHAEHYYRLLHREDGEESRRARAGQPLRGPGSQDEDFDDDDDDDDDADAVDEVIAAPPPPPPQPSRPRRAPVAEPEAPASSEPNPA